MQNEIMPLITDEEAVTQMLGAKITCTISVATAEVDKQFLIHLVGGVRKLQRDADLKVLDKIKAGWVETYNEQVVICRNLREAHGLELEAERKKWAEKIADRIENCLNISPKELPRIIAELRRGRVEYYGEGTVTDPRDKQYLNKKGE